MIQQLHDIATSRLNTENQYTISILYFCIKSGKVSKIKHLDNITYIKYNTVRHTLRYIHDITRIIDTLLSPSLHNIMSSICAKSKRLLIRDLCI